MDDIDYIGIVQSLFVRRATKSPYPIVWWIVTIGIIGAFLYHHMKK